jgi:hypothetical protein
MMMQKARNAQMQPPMQPHANNMMLGGHNQLPSSGGGTGQLNPMAGAGASGASGPASLPMHMQQQQPMNTFPMNSSSSQMPTSAMPGGANAAGAGGAFSAQQQQAQQVMMMQRQQAYTQRMRMEQQQRLAQAQAQAAQAALGHGIPTSASPVSASSPSDPALMGLRSNPVMPSIARTTQSPAESVSSPMTPHSQSRLPSAGHDDFQRSMMQQQQNAAAVAAGQQQSGWPSMQQQNAVAFNNAQMGAMNGINPMATWQQQQNSGQGSVGQSAPGLPGLAMGQIQAGNTFSMPLSAGPSSGSGAGAQFSPAASSPVRSWSPSTAGGMGVGNMGGPPFSFVASPAPSHHGERPTTPRHPASSSSTPAPGMQQGGMAGIPDDISNMFNWPGQ